MTNRYRQWASTILVHFALIGRDPTASLANGHDSREVLTKFFDALNGDDWERSQNWYSQTESICTWAGITCAEDKEEVLSISLGDNNLVGTIPMTELLQLPYLEVLDLNGNDDMEFPAFIDANLVEDAYKAGIHSNLKRINFEDCEIENLNGIFGNADGSGIPVIFDKLVYLNLGDVDMEGPFPPQILKMTNLKELDISDNEFEGEIPYGLTQLKELKSLDLSDNDFKMDFPAWMNDLSTNLEYLILSDNELFGAMKDISKLTNLEVLDLSDQYLNGPLPPLDNLPKLVDVDLSDNEFTGPVPQNFLASINTNELKYVDISDNHLTGAIPYAPFKNFAAETTSWEDNLFTSIEDALCSAPQADGQGCDGIACPPGKRHDDGRTGDGLSACKPCEPFDPEKDKYFGSTMCGSNEAYEDDDEYDDDDDDESDEDDDEDDDDDDDDDVVGDFDYGTIPEGHSDRDVLIALYKLTNGYGWKRDDNWEYDGTVCNWEGITCNDDDQVTSINLNKNGMQGPVPLMKLLQMPFLEDLNLGNNPGLTFAGSIDPNDVYDENKSGIHAKLQLLNLEDCKIENLNGVFGNVDGSGIPIFMENLRILNLINTGLTGEFPPKILAFTKLQELQLADNRLEGHIPQLLGPTFKDLKVLDLERNRFDGWVPENFNLLTNLVELDLDRNQLEGELRPNFNLMPNLKFLAMAHNQIHGNLPSLNALPKLARLDLADNKFSGPIPPDFLAAINPELFVILNLSDNYLTGQVPAAPFKGLEPDSFWLGDNLLTSIEPELCDSSAAGGYGCDGIICKPGYWTDDGNASEDDGVCKKCDSADPADNTLGATDCDDEYDDDDDDDDDDDEDDDQFGLGSGGGDTSSRDLSDRDILNAIYEATDGGMWKRNEGWGEDDTSICMWEGVTCTQDQTKEQVLSITLTKNKLRGILPMTKILLLPYLESLRLSDNRDLVIPDIIDSSLVTGSVINSKIEQLDLEDCNLNTVNGIFGNADGSGVTVTMTNLKSLDLEGNDLQGPFPPQILTFTKLKDLDLSYNDFSGELPSGLSSMNDLKRLDLNNNSFSGNLPTWISQLTNLKELDLSENELTGPLIEGLNSMTKLNILNLGDNALTGVLLDFAQLSDLSILYLSDNKFGGDIPSQFIRGIWEPFSDPNKANPSNWRVVDIGYNYLKTIPKDPFMYLPPGTFYINDNEITSINQELCSSSAAGGYGCDGILCPPKTFNRYGVAGIDGGTCKPCSTPDPEVANFYGMTDCNGDSADDDDDDVDDDVSDSSSSDDGTIPLPTGSTDRDILKALYIATKGDYWERNLGWYEDDVSLCEWEGVTCTEDTEKEQVLSILLSRNNMQGTVPFARLLQLPYLEDLNLSNNDDLVFPSYIDPNDVFEGHKDGIISNLKVLELGDCNIDDLGGIFGKPDGSGIPVKMENLKVLGLSDVGLDGPIPSQILGFTKLTSLDLSDNDFEGQIPSGLAELKNMKKLDLSDNELEGEIPEWIGGFPELQSLDISDNYLTGPLKNALNSLTNLLYLFISENNFDGPLLPLEGLTKLKTVDFSSNSLNGQIPVNFLSGVNPDLINVVDLGENKLTGVVPAAPFKKFGGDSIWVYDNMFTSIDPELCNSPAAGGYGCDGIACKVGYYNDNGNADDEDGECTKCDTIDTSVFSFVGSSACIGTADEDDDDDDDDNGNEDNDNGGGVVEKPNGYSDRDVLMLLQYKTGGQGGLWERDDNWGDNDVSICEWEGVTCTDDSSKEQVFSISLTKNNMKGEVPMEYLLQMPFLEDLNLADNDDLTFPTFIDPNHVDVAFHTGGIVSNLKRLNLEDTEIINLEGIFGKADGSGIQVIMNDLKFLVLEDTEIEGPFPTQILKFTKLQELNLADNDLEGVIPDGIGGLKDLTVLDLSDNDFEGEIPDSFSQLTKLTTLDLGDNELTGPLKSFINSMTSLMYFSVMENGLTGSVLPLENSSNLKSVDFSSNYLTGPIPSNFMASINADMFMNVDLSDNQLTGQVPAAPFKNLKPDTFWLSDNHLTSIDPMLCASPAAGTYGCDGILCPAGKYTDGGNANEDDGVCVVCNSIEPEFANYFGQSDCDDDEDDDDDDDDESVSVSQEDDDDDDDDDDAEEKDDVDLGSEREILLKFYDTCNGQLWYHQDGWRSSDICTWEGIKCVDGQRSVEEIVLGSNNVECVNPFEIFDLPNLKKLLLYGNMITFSFYGISKAEKLEELSLDHTDTYELKGLEKAPDSLKRLTLNGCKLDGTFPSEILSLRSLEYLSIANNRLTGALPDGFQNMINLNALIVGKNELTGGLKDVVLGPTTREIDLSGNNFDGSIPTTFLTTLNSNLPIHVDLSNNLLTGTVPASLERIQFLNIDLKDNFLVGVNENLCQRSEWNDGLVGKYGCHAILCPKGFTAYGGKQTSETGKCIPCEDAQYFGDSKCFEELIYASSTNIPFMNGLIMMFVVGVSLFLTL